MEILCFSLDNSDVKIAAFDSRFKLEEDRLKFVVHFAWNNILRNIMYEWEIFAKRSARNIWDKSWRVSRRALIDLIDIF